MSARKLTPSVFVALAVVVMAASLLPRPARAITTAQIMASAISPGCLGYQLIGVCVWMTCTPLGCDIDTSIEVRHYMPDLVVSTYHRTGENPWPIISALVPPNPLSRAGGVGTEDLPAQIHNNLRFKNADAIGHPGQSALSPLLSVLPYACDSAATPMQPYYLSVYDPLAWRAGIPESVYPEALIPGMRSIGNPGNVWGHVYPRSGFVIQANDYKAAAVAAQRVADFVTRLWQPHVYIPLHESSRPGYWPPGPVVEGDPDTHKWQRLQPNMTTACQVFPDRGSVASFAGDIAADGDYVWALWRPYTCCERRGATLIFYVPPP